MRSFRVGLRRGSLAAPGFVAGGLQRKAGRLAMSRPAGGNPSVEPRYALMNGLAAFKTAAISKPLSNGLGAIFWPLRKRIAPA
jgi:hypothetical protein